MSEIKWVKIIDENTKEVQLGAGQDAEYYASIGMTEQEVEQAYNGTWYLKGYCPAEPQEDVIKKQIAELENQITPRNFRGAILGDEFALNKITQIEEQIAQLREQLQEK